MKPRIDPKNIDLDEEKDDLEAEKRKRLKIMRKLWAEKREKQLRKRTGLTRHNSDLIVHGLKMRMIGSPVIARERWIKVPRGRKYHFAVLRYCLQDHRGQFWTAYQGACHDANYGYVLSITGLYSLKPA